MLNVILFGPPGAGKGTQSQNIIKKYELVHFSTGDILRAEIAAETDLGVIAKLYMDKGELVPDEVAIGMIKAKILANRNSKGFIFDGFPRTVTQANELDEILELEKMPVSVMIALDVEHNELVKRLNGRAFEGDRVDDKDIKIIENRLEIYRKTTYPVIDFYQAQGKFKLINGIGTMDTIFSRICAEIDKVI